MNKLELMKKRNEIARLIRPNNRVGSHRHCFRLGSGGDKHEHKKLDICMTLRSMGHEFFTEAHLNPPFKGIIDILDLDTGTAYEIMDSETDESIKKKAAKYPKSLQIRKVKVD